MAHLKYLKFLDYRLVDNASVNAAKEQYQDELLELEVISIHVHIVVYVHVIRCISNNQREPVFSIFHFSYNNNKKKNVFQEKERLEEAGEAERKVAQEKRTRLAAAYLQGVDTLLSDVLNEDPELPRYFMINCFRIFVNVY